MICTPTHPPSRSSEASAGQGQASSCNCLMLLRPGRSLATRRLRVRPLRHPPLRKTHNAGPLYSYFQVNPATKNPTTDNMTVHEQAQIGSPAVALINSRVKRQPPPSPPRRASRHGVRTNLEMSQDGTHDHLTLEVRVPKSPKGSACSRSCVSCSSCVMQPSSSHFPRPHIYMYTPRLMLHATARYQVGTAVQRVYMYYTCSACIYMSIRVYMVMSVCQSRVPAWPESRSSPFLRTFLFSTLTFLACVCASVHVACKHVCGV